MQILRMKDESQGQSQWRGLYNSGVVMVGKGKKGERTHLIIRELLERVDGKEKVATGKKRENKRGENPEERTNGRGWRKKKE